MDEPLPGPRENDEAQPPPEAPAAPSPARPAWREFHAKLLAVLFLMALMGLFLLQVPWATESTSESQNQTTPPLAELMFEGYGASFVLLSIVMGVAIIGGLFLAKEDPAEDGPEPDREARGEKGAPPQARDGKAAAEKGNEERNEGGGGGGADGEREGGEAA